MGEARRRQLSGDYPKYTALTPLVEKRQAGFEQRAGPLGWFPRIKSYLIGPGQQIARRDGRA